MSDIFNLKGPDWMVNLVTVNSTLAGVTCL